MSPTPSHRLRKHADYQLVYKYGRKQYSRNIAYFHALRAALAQNGVERRSDTPGPRIGLTVPKALGGAVTRNRIKRRLREAIRAHLTALTAPVDVILHPRKIAATMEFAALSAEVRSIFTAVQRAADHPHAPAQKLVTARPNSATMAVSAKPPHA